MTGAIYGDDVDPDDVEPPLDAHGLAYLRFERSKHEPARRALRTRWIVAAAALIAVTAMVVGIVVFNASAPGPARGAASAKTAAKEFVTALNAGDALAAAAISCAEFAEDARSAARSGKDPAFRYTLDSVRLDDTTSATAVVSAHLALPGSTQTKAHDISVLRSSGRWLMCGRAS